MNVEHGPTEVTESRERHSYARLHGRWLVLARVGWVVLAVFTLIVVVASLPVYIAQLQTLCAGAVTACSFSHHLSPAQARLLGLSLGNYAAYRVALTLTTMVVCLLFSPAIISPTSYHCFALFFPLLL